jgi:hypothetical protein
MHRKPGSPTDASMFSLKLERYRHEAGLMEPMPKHLYSMDSQSKSFGMEKPGENRVFDGLSWSFVDMCSIGLTEELKKVIYFFEVVNSLAKHHSWTGYVFPTTNLGQNDSSSVRVIPKPDPKMEQHGRKGACGALLEVFLDEDRGLSWKGDGPGVDTSHLLASSNAVETGLVYTQLPLLSIHVGFTGAEFKVRVKVNSSGGENDDGWDNEEDDIDNEDDIEEDIEDEEDNEDKRKRPRSESTNHKKNRYNTEQRQMIFGVVTVTGLINVDTLRFILDVLVAPPPMSRSVGFSSASVRHMELMEMLEHILIYQTSEALADKSGRRPSEFYGNPTGPLGIDTICCPAYEPIKMINLIRRNHRDVSDVRIIGYPDIDWMVFYFYFIFYFYFNQN